MARSQTATKSDLLDLKTTDRILKAMLVLSRTVDHILESGAIEVSGKPLSKSKIQILRLLGQRGGQHSTQIAGYLGVSKPAVTQIVDSLMAGRMVKRVPSKRDRRGFELQLTATGRKVFRRIQAHQRHLIRGAISRSRHDQADLWVELLQGMAGALTQADRSFRKYCFQCEAHNDGSCVLVAGKADCPYLKS